MKEKVLHLGLKILSSPEHSITGEKIAVIPEYEKMIKEKGFAWYNKTKYWEEQPHGSKLAKKRVDKFKQQFDDGIETKLFLFENVPSERCFEATILDYTTEIENIDFEAYPDKWADSEKADYFLKITNIKQVDRMKTLLKLTMYEQPDTSVEEFIEKFGGRNAKWLLTEREIDLQEKEIQREFSKKIKEGGPDLKRKIKEALNNMDETDRPGNKNKSRNEQGLLRTNLFSDAEEFSEDACHEP